MNRDDLERISPDGMYDVRHQLRQHVYNRSTAAFAAGDAARDAIATPEALEARQRHIRAAFLAGIGGLPAADTPLNPRVTGVVEGDGFRVEKVLFESRPRHFVTANLYLPEGGAEEPTGAVLFVCGHHRDAKHHPEYQSVCQRLVRAGLVVLAQDPIGQGERLGYWEPSRSESTVGWGTTEHDHIGAQCLPLGDALARYFLHDALRGLDYLASRPEVDPARIGITGNSGGGTQTSLVLLAAADRIAAAAPATFIMDRESYLWCGGAQDAEQIWPGFSGSGLDHEDILIAMAPKPVRVLAVAQDFFPIEGTRRTVERAKRIWAAAGNPEGIDLVEDDDIHWYTDALQRAATVFFARHLLGCDVTPEDAAVRPFPPEALWCTLSGQTRGEVPGAESVYETNQRRLAEPSAPIDLHGLRERVLQHRQPTDFNPRFYHRGQIEELRLAALFWWAQKDLISHAFLFRPADRDGQDLPAVLALWDGGTRTARARFDWIRSACAAGVAVAVLDVSGHGALMPHAISGRPAEATYGTIHKLSTDLLFLGDDLVSLRTFDTLRGLELLLRLPGIDAAAPVRIVASGRTGLYGRLAARLDPRVGAVDVAEDSFPGWRTWIGQRHYDGRGIYEVILPGALRYGDLFGERDA